ncbi:hypothetical protein RRG08_055377 [Elysia crispata]|uniref:Uncharacterized protein n=1 Tax=Elysia crispata TaxID=231223 RepID=A0AAE1AQK6_9GAST|nr:hypothetical protein RRG08_055377 [Elysia crispata]
MLCERSYDQRDCLLCFSDSDTGSTRRRRHASSIVYGLCPPLTPSLVSPHTAPTSGLWTWATREIMVRGLDRGQGAPKDEHSATTVVKTWERERSMFVYTGSRPVIVSIPDYRTASGGTRFYLVYTGSRPVIVSIPDYRTASGGTRFYLVYTGSRPVIVSIPDYRTASGGTRFYLGSLDMIFINKRRHFVLNSDMNEEATLVLRCKGSEFYPLTLSIPSTTEMFMIKIGVFKGDKMNKF